MKTTLGWKYFCVRDVSPHGSGQERGLPACAAAAASASGSRCFGSASRMGLSCIGT